MAARGTPAIDALVRARVAFTLHEYALPDLGARESRHAFGLEAAAALGLPPERLFKTLVASMDDRLAVGIVPVSAELDLKALAAAAGGRRAVMADPAVAERATGYVVGGISPLGQKRHLPAVLDASALGHGTILVSAGRRGLQVELAPQDLIRVLGATVALIRRDG